MTARAERWLAMVAGSGGWIHRAGRFDLTNAGAVYGLKTIIRWQRQYGPNPLRTFANASDLSNFTTHTAYGMGPEATNPPSFLFAPFPRLPQASPIPLAVRGLAVLHSADSVADAALLTVLGELVAWLYLPAQQRLLARYGLPPLLGDPSVQDGYWSGAPWPGLVPPGGWRRFASGLEGVPALAPLDDVGAVLDAYASPVRDVDGLAGDLEQVEVRLNAWQQAQGADVGAAGG